MTEYGNGETPLEVTTEMLEAYVLGHLGQDARRRLEQHLSNAPGDRRRLQRVSDEVSRIKELTTKARGSPPGPCPDDLRLALFVDHSCGAEQRQELERHLALCHACQKRLVELYRELHAAKDPRQTVPTVTRHPRGESISLDAAPAGSEAAPSKGASAEKHEKPEKCREEIDKRHSGGI